LRSDTPSGLQCQVDGVIRDGKPSG
jgi:hypothetical protein